MIRAFVRLHRLGARVAGRLVQARTAVWTRHVFARCGHRCRLRFARLVNPDRMEIGHAVETLWGCRLEACIEWEGERFEPRIVIGDRVKIGQNLHMTCSDRIVIEEDVNITANVTISDTVHRYDGRVDLPIEQAPLSNAPIRIGAGSKINNGVVIMPGVTIGRHCSIGANSVVTTDIPDNSVAVGAPARVVRRLDGRTSEWRRVEHAPPIETKEAL